MVLPLPYRARMRGRQRPLFAAIGALGLVLALGSFGPRLPGLWDMLLPLGLMPAMGLVLAGGAGLLAYHLAQLAAVPGAGVARGMFPAVLIPAATIPGVGAAALLAVLAAATILAWQAPGQRLVALVALSGAAMGLAGACLESPLLGGCGTVPMLAAAWVSMRMPVHPAANDNPSMERIADI